MIDYLLALSWFTGLCSLGLGLIMLFSHYYFVPVGVSIIALRITGAVLSVIGVLGMGAVQKKLSV